MTLIQGIFIGLVVLGIIVYIINKIAYKRKYRKDE